MTHGDIFLIVRTSAFLLVCCLQYVVFREVKILHAIRISKIKIGLLAFLFVSVNLPGALIAFAGHVAIPAWIIVPLIYFYLLWQMTGVVFLIALASGRFILSLRLSNESREHALSRRYHELPAQVDKARRSFLREGYFGISILCSGGILAGCASNEEYEIVARNIRMPRFPEKLRGLRIALIADIHSGPFVSKQDLDRYIDVVRNLNADLVLIPGDFIQNKNEEVEPLCEALRSLRPQFGIYGCLGNHEYFADADFVAKELEHADVWMLRNEHVVIDPNGERLALIGLDDVRTGFPFDSLFSKAVEGLNASIPNILLCHKPYYFEDASAYGVNLTVSGHTHGGQVVLSRILGIVISPVAIVSGYMEGLYTLDASQLYVTRGLGTVGVPIRINCPPEITLLTLE